jgi:hypothetical protein
MYGAIDPPGALVSLRRCLYSSPFSALHYRVPISPPFSLFRVSAINSTKSQLTSHSVLYQSTARSIISGIVFRLPNQKYLNISHLSHMQYMTRRNNLLLFDHPIIFGENINCIFSTIQSKYIKLQPLM